MVREKLNDENYNVLNKIHLTAQKKAPIAKILTSTSTKFAPSGGAQISVMKRPMTAKITNGVISNPPLLKKQTVMKKKTDPVSRYQSMQNQWQRNNFLKSSDNKQGRKLELDRFHKWSSVVHAQNEPCKKKSQKQGPAVKGPTEDRRDDMRFQLRAKISQKDYLDKNMKVYHYNQEILSKAHVGSRPSTTSGLPSHVGTGGEDKLDQLKKQIENLKKCIML